jgi:D-glycero-D-manno-heptose 1,7-bisphosphate phosphatase
MDARTERVKNPFYMTVRKVVFLDRDGTINVDRGYVARIDDWEFAPGAIAGLKLLRSAGYSLAVVTNQSGIARGYYTADDVSKLHAHMLALLAAEGVALDAVACCPHAPDEHCGCRKPLTGMARQVEAQIAETIDTAGSWTIGDKPADVQFGASLGTRTVLLESRYWTAGEFDAAPTHIAASLLAAAQFIARESACSAD